MTQRSIESTSLERRQKIVQRALDFFPGPLDDLAHLAQQDRQALHGWEESAHLRATLRRAADEGPGAPAATTQVAIAEPEIVREAGEPERGEQREALGQLLEVGGSALEKIARDQTQDLNAKELGGLECVLLLYGRPALQVSQRMFASVPPLWKGLEEHRSDIELALRGVSWPERGRDQAPGCHLLTSHPTMRPSESTRQRCVAGSDTI